MIDFTIDVQGTDVLIRALEKGINLDEPIGRAMGEWATSLLDDRLYGMRNYAPPPPNSSYVRTGTLGANWGLARHGKTGVEFNNTTSYAGYVVGNRDGGGQAAIHAGRWWLARQRVEEGLEDAGKRIEKAIGEALGV